MTIAIAGTNVNDVFYSALIQMRFKGTAARSRTGAIIRINEPVAILMRKPCQRVLFDIVRDANPFFHLLEGLWMLAGRNDVGPLAWVVPHMFSFSDDGWKLHGAYGHRWRHHWDMDQIMEAADELKADPDSRRVVLQMWDPAADLHQSGRKDVPCNLSITFDRRDDINEEPGIWRRPLNMTVFNRSNDLIWGALGANAVHMSMLQEYMAAMVGCSVGWYEQITSDLHVYQAVWTQGLHKRDRPFHPEEDPYQTCATAKETPLVNVEIELWDKELFAFWDMWDEQGRPLVQQMLGYDWKEEFFGYVVVPMVQAYEAYRTQLLDDGARLLARHAEGYDWHLAGQQWLERRIANREEKDPQGGRL